MSSNCKIHTNAEDANFDRCSICAHARIAQLEAELDHEKNANTWSRLKDRIFQLEAALRTIAAYRGKNAVAHQLAYIAEAALDSETPPQPDGDYTDSIDIEPSCGTSETGAKSDV